MTSRLLTIKGLRQWLAQDIYLWLQLLVLVGVLLLSAVLAFKVSSGYLIVFLGLLPVAGIILSFWRWPALGLVSLIPASLVVAFAIGTDSNTSINASLLLVTLLLGLWVLNMVRQHKIWLVPARLLLPLLGLVVVAGLSFGFGQLAWYPISGAPMQAQIGALALFPLSAGAFLLVAHQVPTLRWLEWMTWLFLTLGGLFIATLLWPGLARFTQSLVQPGVNGRLSQGLFQVPGAIGSLFWLWLVVLAFSQAGFNRQLHPGWRLALGGLVVATLYNSLIARQAWTSGWLPSLVALAAVLWIGAPRLRLPLFLVGVAVLAPRMHELYNEYLLAGNEYSLTTRLAAWRIVLEISKVNPILGLGPANYYGYTSLFPIFGYYVKFNSHNNYVDIIAQTGWLGLACFLWFAGEVGWLGWRLRARVPAGFAQAYVYGALGGLAGMLVAAMLGDWVLPFVYNIGFKGFRASVLGWLFLGGLVALQAIFGDRKSQSNFESTV